MYAVAEYLDPRTGQQASISLQSQRLGYVVRLKRARQLEEMERVYSLQEANQLASGYQTTLQTQYGMQRVA